MNGYDIRQSVKETVELAHRVFPNLKMDIPQVEFFHRGTKGGVAHLTENKIKLNAVLAAENGDKFKNTIVHEIAHIIAYKLYGERGHGYTFKSVFLHLGGNGKRTHSYDVSSVKQKYTKRRHEYTCNCSGKFYWLSAQKHRQLRTSPSRWFCKVCKTLVPTGKVKETVNGKSQIFIGEY